MIVYFGSFFTEVTQMFGQLFNRVKFHALILAKNGLGYILGGFFANTSGVTLAEIFG
jgi:hypothetical protein